MARSTFLPVLLIPGLFFLVGCSAGPRRPALSPPPAHHDRAQVLVTNLGWQEAIVYAVLDGHRNPVRLGSVTAMSQRRLSLRMAIPRLVRFELRAIGGNARFLTPAIHVTPGDLMELQIHEYTALSSVARLRGPPSKARAAPPGSLAHR